MHPPSRSPGCRPRLPTAASSTAPPRRLTAYWAECEAAAGDLPAARAVWDAALKGPAGRYADAWAAAVDFERRRGHVREARALYKRSYA